MKPLIIALLALNMVYFVWALTLGGNDYVPPKRTKDGVPPVILIPTVNSYAYQSKDSKLQSSCYTLGPFASSRVALLVAKNIRNYGLAITIRKQKTMQTLNFLVYLQAQPSRKAAEKIIKEIKKHKIENYKIIESGPYKNAISLGFFDDLDKARRHSEYVRFLGYDARYTARKKKKEVHWVDYDEPFGSKAPVLKWTKKIDPRASVQKIPKACDFLESDE
jgi:hypothetical protein